MVQPGQHRADGGTHAPHHRMGQRLEHGDVASESASSRRDLGADEPGADHAESGAGVERGPKSPGVLDRAQRDHAVEVGLVRQPSGMRARGEQQTVVGEGVVAHPDRVRPDVEVVCRDAEPQVQVQVVEALTAQDDAVAIGAAGEEVLRERRPVVRLVRLGADEGQRTLMALPTQRLHRPQTRERGADDDDAIHGDGRGVTGER